MGKVRRNSMKGYIDMENSHRNIKGEGGNKNGGIDMVSEPEVEFRRFKIIEKILFVIVMSLQRWETSDRTRISDVYAEEVPRMV